MKAVQILWPCIFLLLSQCGGNIFEDMSGDSDASLLYEAKLLGDKSQWTEAIAKFQEMSVDFQAKRENQGFLARLYAGRCGLDFLSLMESLQDAGGSSLFTLLMKSQTGATESHYQDCISAENVIKGISTDATSLNEDENLSMAFIQFTKIGSILSYRADTNADGTADFVNDQSCNDELQPQPGFSSAEAKHILTGFTLAINALSNVALSLGQLDDMSDVCTDIGGCTDTDIADVDATEEKAIRTIVQEGDAGVGLGTCTDSPADLVNCICL